MVSSAAEISLKEGRLDETLAQLQDQVRKNPDVTKHRVFLFQLLAINGQWDRALNQLNVCGNLDPANLAMVQTYREAIRCEILRERVFRGETTPLVFGQPQQWLAQLLIASEFAAKGQYQQAQQTRQQAFELAPTTSGTLNGQPFGWIADADTRLGPVLEAVVNGRYYWIPFCQIAKIALEAPADLRDLVWMPAEFTWTNGGISVGLIPTRYTGSEISEDSAIRLGRKTVWLEPATEEFQGLGQRVLATDTADYSLCDIRELILNNEPV